MGLFRSDVRLLKPATTTVVIRMKNGHERMHRFPGILTGWEMNFRLDALMDEMDDGAIRSPVQIIREHANGKTKTENVRIYSPDE